MTTSSRMPDVVILIDGKENQVASVGCAIPEAHVVAAPPGWPVRQFRLADNERLAAIVMFAEGRETNCISKCRILCRNLDTAETPIILAFEFLHPAFQQLSDDVAADVSAIVGVTEGNEDLLRERIKKVCGSHKS